MSIFALAPAKLNTSQKECIEMRPYKKNYSGKCHNGMCSLIMVFQPIRLLTKEKDHFVSLNQ